MLGILGLVERFNLPLTLERGGVPGNAEHTVCDGNYYPAQRAALDFKPAYANVLAQLAAAGDVAAYDRLIAKRRRLVRAAHGSRMGTFIERVYVPESGRENCKLSAVSLVCMLTERRVVPGEDAVHIYLWGVQRAQPHPRRSRIPQAPAKLWSDVAARPVIAERSQS